MDSDLSGGQRYPPFEQLGLDGKRKRGRPRETWRRSVEREMKEKGWSLGKVVKLAKDKQQWLSLVTVFVVLMILTFCLDFGIF